MNELLLTRRMRCFWVEKQGTCLIKCRTMCAIKLSSRTSKKYQILLDSRYYQTDMDRSLTIGDELKGTDLISVKQCHSILNGQKNLFMNPIAMNTGIKDPTACTDVEKLKPHLDPIIWQEAERLEGMREYLSTGWREIEFMEEQHEKERKRM